MSAKIVTAIASFGMSGKVFHAPLLYNHPNFQVKYILERTKNEVNKYYPDIQVVRTFEELLKDNKTELIIINTPDHTHFELAQKALEAGKNIVVEKPFTQSLREGEELLNLASRKNLMISVFQNRRWDGDFLTVRKIVENKLLGRLVEFESHFDRYRNYIQPDTWKENSDTGTGTLYNLGSHMIDQALVLFGKPDAIFADIRTLRTGGKVDDNYDLKLYYPHTKVELKASYLVREPGPRYILNGTLGSFLKFGIDPQEEALKMGRNPYDSEWGRDSRELWGTLNTEINNLHFYGAIETIPGNYSAFYDGVYDALTRKLPPPVTGEEALDVIKLIEAAFTSFKTHKIINFTN